MEFGGSASEAAARKMIDVARASEVNFIDTADAYAGGASERIVGKLIAKDRADWVLATKVGQRDGTPARKKGLSRQWMMAAIDASLSRLGVDYVDIYYMRHRDRETPLHESVAAMGDIVASGKALYWGFFNHYGWEVAAVIAQSNQMKTAFMAMRLGSIKFVLPLHHGADPGAHHARRTAGDRDIDHDPHHRGRHHGDGFRGLSLRRWSGRPTEEALGRVHSYYCNFRARPCGRGNIILVFCALSRHIAPRRRLVAMRATHR
jgi:hypothetical protein